MPLSRVLAAAVEPLTIAELRRHIRLDESDGEPAPTAPTVALANPAATGNCDNGVWRIGVTFVTADGETELGTLSDIVTVADKTVNGRISVTNIPVGGSTVTARSIYAVSPSTSTARFVATIADNTTTVATVNIAAASLGVGAPSTNTTEDPTLLDWIIAARERAELSTNRAIPGPQTYDWILDRFPIADDFLEVPLPPLLTVVSITYYDTAGVQQTFGPSRYLLTTPVGDRCARGRISLPFATVWPVTLPQRGAVQIRFTCGYTSVPRLLRSAMKLDAATLYVQREGVLDGAQTSVLPMGVRDIYKSYRSHPTQRL